jgi:hypothetical protein
MTKDINTYNSIWRRIDEATFTRFGQFVYTGNYDGEAPTVAPKSSPDPGLEDETSEPVLFASPHETIKQQKAWHDFKFQRCYDHGSVGAYSPKKNTDWREEYTKVFLSHARVHILADEYEMVALLQLSLHKLHRLLSTFELYDERVRDIVELLRCCFEEGGGELLNELVVAYAACKFEKLWKNEGFRHLYTTKKELCRELMDALLSRLD